MLEVLPIGADGVHESKITTSDIEPAVNAETEPVGGVIRWTIRETKSDAFDESLRFVCNAVAIVIDIHADIWRMNEIDPVMIPNEATRGIDIFDKLLHLIGASISIRITEAQDASTLWIAAQRAIAIAGDIEVAIGCGGDIDGVVRCGAVGEEGEVKAVWNFHVLEDGCFLLWGEFYDRRSDVALTGKCASGGLCCEWRNGFNVGSFEQDFANACPSAAVLAERMDLHKPDAVCFSDLVLVGCWLVVGAAIG